MDVVDLGSLADQLILEGRLATVPSIPAAVRHRVERARTRRTGAS